MRFLKVCEDVQHEPQGSEKGQDTWPFINKSFNHLSPILKSPSAVFSVCLAPHGFPNYFLPFLMCVQCEPLGFIAMCEIAL